MGRASPQPPASALPQPSMMMSMASMQSPPSRPLSANSTQNQQQNQLFGDLFQGAAKPASMAQQQSQSMGMSPAIQRQLSSAAPKQPQVQQNHQWNFDALLSSPPTTATAVTVQKSQQASPVPTPSNASGPVLSNDQNVDLLSDFLSGKPVAQTPAAAVSPISLNQQQQHSSPVQAQASPQPTQLKPQSTLVQPPASPIASVPSQQQQQHSRPASVNQPHPTSNAIKQQPQSAPSQKQSAGISDENVTRLVEFGFQEQEARAALFQTNNNLEAAAELMLTQSSSTRTSSQKSDLAARLEKFGLKGKHVELASKWFGQASKLGMAALNQAKSIVKDGAKNLGQMTQNGGDRAHARYRYDEGYAQQLGDEPSSQGPAGFGGMRSSSSHSLERQQPSPVAHQQRTLTAPIVQKPPRAVVQCPPEQLRQSDAMKEQGNTFFKQGQYGDADDKYTQAIHFLPSGHANLVPLLNNRAAAHLKNGKFKEAVQDTTIITDQCRRDLECDLTADEQRETRDALSKALLRRATAFENMEKYDDALQDYRACMEHHSGAKGASEGIRRCTQAISRKTKPVADPVAPNHSSAPQQQSSQAGVPKQDSFDPFAGGPAQQQQSATSALADLGLFASGPTISGPSSSNATGNNFKSENVERLREKERAKEKEDEEKLRAKDGVDARLNQWRQRKEGNIRALLSSLDMVLWDDMKQDWKPVNLSELVTPSQVKVKYMRIIAKLHPDKLSSMSLTAEQQLLANGIFSTLNDAWDAFKTQNNIK